MIRRLLSRAYAEELSIADTVATSMAQATGLPAFQYPTTLDDDEVGASGLSTLEIYWQRGFTVARWFIASRTS